MAQGKKYPDDIKEKARIELTLNNNIAEVSRHTNIPESTLRDWIKKWSAENDDFAELRALRKKEFAERAWVAAFLGIDRTTAAMRNLDTDSVDASDISQLANATSKIYQMHALASGEATARVEGNISIKKFEDIPE